MDKRWKFDPGPLADSIAAHAEACGLTRAQMLRVMVYLFSGPKMEFKVGQPPVEIMGGPTTGPSVDPGPGPSSGKELGFTTFYAAYPRKVGKGEARKAYRQVYESRPTVREMVAAAEALGQHVKDKSKIPYPATWLRRHGWEDNLDDVADGAGPMTERERRAAAGGDPAASAPERKRFHNPYGDET